MLNPLKEHLDSQKERWVKLGNSFTNNYYSVSEELKS
jgi:hypothetical protein